MSESLREKAKRNPQRVTQTLAAALGVCLLCLAALAVFFQATQLRARESAAQIKQSRILALQAWEQLERGDRSLALALEAVKLNLPPDDARLLLSDILSQPGISRIIQLPGQPFMMPASPFAAPYDSPYYLMGLIFSPDGSFALFTVNGQLIQVDTRTGEILKQIPLGGDDYAFTALHAISPDNRHVVMSKKDACIIYDMLMDKVSAALAESSSCIYATFSPDGQYLFASLYDGGGKFYRTDAWQPFMASWGCCPFVTFSPDSSTVLIRDEEALRLFEVKSGQLIQEGLMRPEISVNIIGILGLWASPYSPERYAYAVNVYGEVVRINISSEPGGGMSLETITNSGTGDAFGLIVSPDGRYLAKPVPPPNHKLLMDLIMKPVSGKQSWTFKDAGGAVIAFSSDSSELLTAGASQITVIDLKTYQIEGQPVSALVDLAKSTRYIPDFTCEQRSFYRITPLCGEGAPPTQTGYPVWTPFPTSTPPTGS